MKKIRMCTLAIRYLLITGMMLVTFSCGKDDDEIITQFFELPAYDEILLNAVFDIELREDQQYSLQVTGIKSVIEDLTFEVKDQKLIVDNSSSSLWIHPKTNPAKLIISGIGLKRIEAKETCNIRSLDTITTDNFGILLGGKLNIADLMVHCTSFYYWNTSPVGGKLTVRGKADNVSIYNGALMAVDASALECDLATVETGSKSDVQVFVRKKLDYSISGTGNIYLSGNPDEIVPGFLTSSGRLIH